VLHAEVERLIDTVRGVRGVSDVRNELEPHEQATGVPGLQGGPSRRRARANTPELMQENWSPGIRLCAGSAAASMIVMAAAKRDLLGLGLGLIGGVMLSRAITNESLGRVTGVSAGRRAVDIVKTIEIGAPIEEVWAFWNNFENFPKFMTHVLEVRDLGNGRSHWVAEGPTGMQVAWDAEITRSVPNQVLAWKSVPGSRVDNAGVLRFDPGAHGGTRVHIRFSYNPPGGAIGHAIAWLFGRDAKTEMDEDLVRLKSLLEDGRTLSRDRRRVMRGDLTAPAPTM
jgi:uncharacterized membrane protein